MIWDFFWGRFSEALYMPITNYAFMFRVMSVSVAIALVCFIIIMPIYNRRVTELEQLSQKNRTG